MAARLSGPPKPSNPPVLTSANLRIFESVARCSGFSRAAEELGVSQPYVSAQIAELEQKLDLILFRRVGRRVYLTDAGDRLHVHAKSVLAQLALAEDSMSELRRKVLGRLECATTVIPAQYILPSFLEQLAGTHPGLQVVLHVSGSREVEASVGSGRVELGLTLSQSIPDDLEGTTIGHDDLKVIVGPGHRCAAQETIAPHDLAAETLIVRELASGTRIMVEAIFASLGLSIKYGPELNNNEVIKSLVAAGVGVGMLSSRAVADDVRDGRLRALALEGVDLSRPIRVVVRRGQSLTRAAEIFRSSLLAFCGVDAPSPATE
jgi:DNA-binding transcriptional LysR family regulator